MGKRELVLIAVFVALGIGVYQLTAPPPPPGSEGVTFSGIFRNMRRGIQGARETATSDASQTIPIDTAIRELRINVTRSSDITVTGEDRADLAAEFHTSARGFDQVEAKAFAAGTTLKIERIGDAVVVSLDNTAARSLRGNGGINQMVISLKVPRRLAFRMEPHPGRLSLSQLASAEIMSSRGETRIAGIPGRVTLTHTGGEIDLDNIGSLKLTARNSRGSIKRVGAITVESTGGELNFSELTGPLEVEARNTDLRIEDSKALKPPLRINATSGDIRIEGLRVEARLDGRNSRIEVALAAAAPVTIYNLGEIRFTAPPGGYTLDAVAAEGHITIDDGDLKPSEGTDPRAAGPVRGGGPTVTLRSTRGSIAVRTPTGK